MKLNMDDLPGGWGLLWLLQQAVSDGEATGGIILEGPFD